jgi:hypothetical protein
VVFWSFSLGGREKKIGGGRPHGYPLTLLIHWLAAHVAIAFSDTRGAMRRGASCTGPGERAPAVAGDALARDRVHDRAGRTSDGRTCEKSRLFEHDVRGVASQVVGALEQIARNPGALDGAARRGDREGGEGTARGVESVESGGRLGGPLLQILGSFGGKSSGGHLLFLHGLPFFFCPSFPRRPSGGQKKIVFWEFLMAVHSW